MKSLTLAIEYIEEMLGSDADDSETLHYIKDSDAPDRLTVAIEYIEELLGSDADGSETLNYIKSLV